MVVETKEMNIEKRLQTWTVLPTFKMGENKNWLHLRFKKNK
jgi:hypothetical protein